ncbi:MAG: hypothetical protein KatS3mg002_0323 [Candidatus Woesearchaeota archaeon]|nr:MAG: hypothetical protein KatS3mg002_0323 [Candidatus Woesearchaeota archaeon]
MPIYPTQERTIDPFSDRNSANVNKFSQILTRGKNVILNYNDFQLTKLSNTTFKVSAGSCIIDNVLIKVTNDTVIDITSTNSFFSNGTTTATGKYYVCLKYNYSRSRPAPQAGFVILKPNEHGLVTANKLLFIGVLNIIQSSGVYVIDTVENSDLNDLTNGSRQYVDFFAGIYPNLPTFNANIHTGMIIFSENDGGIYFGNSSGWEKITQLKYTMNTSACNPGDLFKFADSAGTQATPITGPSDIDNIIGVVETSGSVGTVIYSGRMTVNVESGITINAGDLLYISSTENGKVTNIGDLDDIPIGIALTQSNSGKVDILLRIKGSSTSSVESDNISQADTSGFDVGTIVTFTTGNTLIASSIDQNPSVLGVVIQSSINGFIKRLGKVTVKIDSQSFIFSPGTPLYLSEKEPGTATSFNYPGSIFLGYAITGGSPGGTADILLLANDKSHDYPYPRFPKSSHESSFKLGRQSLSANAYTIKYSDLMEPLSTSRIVALDADDNYVYALIINTITLKVFISQIPINGSLDTLMTYDKYSTYITTVNGINTTFSSLISSCYIFSSSNNIIAIFPDNNDTEFKIVVYNRVNHNLDIFTHTGTLWSPIWFSGNIAFAHTQKNIKILNLDSKTFTDIDISNLDNNISTIYSLGTTNVDTTRLEYQDASLVVLSSYNSDINLRASFLSPAYSSAGDIIDFNLNNQSDIGVKYTNDSLSPKSTLIPYANSFIGILNSSSSTSRDIIVISPKKDIGRVFTRDFKWTRYDPNEPYNNTTVLNTAILRREENSLQKLIKFLNINGNLYIVSNYSGFDSNFPSFIMKVPYERINAYLQNYQRYDSKFDSFNYNLCFKFPNEVTADDLELIVNNSNSVFVTANDGKNLLGKVVEPQENSLLTNVDKTILDSIISGDFENYDSCLFAPHSGGHINLKPSRWMDYGSLSGDMITGGWEGDIYTSVTSSRTYSIKGQYKVQVTMGAFDTDNKEIYSKPIALTPGIYKCRIFVNQDYHIPFTLYLSYRQADDTEIYKTKIMSFPGWDQNNNSIFNGINFYEFPFTIPGIGTSGFVYARLYVEVEPSVRLLSGSINLGAIEIERDNRIPFGFELDDLRKSQIDWTPFSTLYTFDYSINSGSFSKIYRFLTIIPDFGTYTSNNYLLVAWRTRPANTNDNIYSRITLHVFDDSNPTPSMSILNGNERVNGDYAGGYKMILHYVDVSSLARGRLALVTLEHRGNGTSRLEYFADRTISKLFYFAHYPSSDNIPTVVTNVSDPIPWYTSS